MQNKVRNTNKLILFVLCAVLLIAVVFTAAIAIPAKAESYTILDDFTGTDFDISDYPIKSDDYSLEVIQLAETENNGLVVYVYQPSGGNKETLATSINIATGNDYWFSYKLAYLGNYSTIYKYKVQDLFVSSDSKRSYDVSAIYRAFNADIDEPADNDNTVNEIAYSVGRQWAVQTVDGKKEYSVKDIELITITDEWVGLNRYLSGLEGVDLTWVDNYFVAFSTNRQIDTLLEADIYYSAETRRDTYNTMVHTHTGKILDTYSDVVHLTSTDTDNNNADDTIAEPHTWDCIQTATEFLETEELTDSAKANIQDKQWVLRFLSADYTFTYYVVEYYYTRTIVTDVAILSLKFETNGVVYNLGVVDDKVTGSYNPANTNTLDVVPNRYRGSRSRWQKFLDSIVSFFKGVANFFTSLFDGFSSSWWKWLIIILVVLFVVGCFLPVIGPILISFLKLIGKGILAVLKALWWLICLPFRGIAALVRKIKERKAGSA